MTAIRRFLSREGEPTRGQRRTLVVVCAIAIALTGVLLLNSPHGPGALIVLGVILLLSVPLYALQSFRRNVFKRSNPDERERQRRNDAYRISYRILEFALPVGLFVAVWFDVPVTPERWLWVYLPLIWYVIFLPYMVFAWREPDAAPD